MDNKHDNMPNEFRYHNRTDCISDMNEQLLTNRIKSLHREMDLSIKSANCKDTIDLVMNLVEHIKQTANNQRKILTRKVVKI
jgi:hypothetical protein